MENQRPMCHRNDQPKGYNAIKGMFRVTKYLSENPIYLGQKYIERNMKKQEAFFMRLKRA